LVSIIETRKLDDALAPQRLMALFAVTNRCNFSWQPLRQVPGICFT
jgi:hypothetical protein